MPTTTVVTYAPSRDTVSPLTPFVPLRAGTTFVLAGLAAQGETVAENVYQIERCHSDVKGRLRRLGPQITREGIEN